MAEIAPSAPAGEKKKNRSGSATRRRTPIVRFRATEAERAEIVAGAERAGLTVGSYVRTRVLTTPTTRSVRRPTVERTLLAQLLGQLGRVGGNIHQITKKLNYGEGIPRTELETALVAFREAADAIMQTLGKRRRDH